MPLYEYHCDTCGHRFEHIQKFSDPLLTVCPKCDGELRKLVSSPAFQFKGTGWYVTDYAKKDRGEADKSSEGKDGASDKKATSDKTDKTAKTDKTKSGGSTSSSDSSKPGSSQKTSSSSTSSS